MSTLLLPTLYTYAQATEHTEVFAVYVAEIG